MDSRGVLTNHTALRPFLLLHLLRLFWELLCRHFLLSVLLLLKNIEPLSIKLEIYQVVKPTINIYLIFWIYFFILFFLRSCFLLLLTCFVYSFSLCSICSVFSIFSYFKGKYMHFPFSGSTITETKCIMLMAGKQTRISTFSTSSILIYVAGMVKIKYIV